LFLFVNINENLFKVIVCHRVVQGIEYDSKIELTVTSAYTIVLKSNMKVSNTHSQVLLNYFTQATHVRLLVSYNLTGLAFFDILA
jgi:hypothetical protein